MRIAKQTYYKEEGFAESIHTRMRIANAVQMQKQRKEYL